MNQILNKEAFDDLYVKYNRRALVHPDPLEFLYRYQDIREREIVALIASSLAYGRVAQILKSVSSLFDKMDNPHNFILNTTKDKMERIFKGFKHRFTTAREIAMLFEGIKNVIRSYNSIKDCFLEQFNETDQNVFPALYRFSEILQKGAPCRSSLIPLPYKKSSFKRLNLFLRWMVRRDEIDPGGWDEIPPSKLIYPLDTHIHRFGIVLGLTARKQNDCQTAVEITDAFRQINPEDPVRYDFAMSSLSARNKSDVSLLIKKYRLILPK